MQSRHCEFCGEEIKLDPIGRLLLNVLDRTTPPDMIIKILHIECIDLMDQIDASFPRLFDQEQA